MKAMPQCLVKLAIFTLVLTLPCLVSAQEQVAPVSRVGVVNIDVLLKNSRYVKYMNDEINNKYKPLIDNIQRIESELKAEDEALRSNIQIRPGTIDHKIALLDLEKKAMNLRKLQDEYQAKVRVSKKNLYTKFYADMQKAITRMGEHFKYDLILTAHTPEIPAEAAASNDPEVIQSIILSRNVQYISASINLTNPVLELMNQEFDRQRPTAADL